jgi:hypothetical protein
MRIFGSILGGLMIAVGIIWIQPGSFMTGQIAWAWRGTFIAITGILLVWLVNRNRR